MPYIYDADFLDYTERSSRHSAARTVALLLAKLPVHSVLDVGCARGTWLDQWQKAGAGVVFGVDGDYVRPEHLSISGESFLATDLAQSFDLRRQFDLVQSLEVAEHVAATSADIFVQNLVRHSKGMIFFSAAPPGQGGEFHVNEQPYEYWREKFRAHGYAAYDYIRPLLADDRAISFWYRFNPMLYLTEEGAKRLPETVLATRVPDNAPIPDVAPLWFKLRKLVIRALPFAVQQSLARLKARTMASRGVSIV